MVYPNNSKWFLCLLLIINFFINFSDGFRTNDLVSVDPELPHVPIISESTDEEFETYDEPYSEPEDGNTDLNDDNKGIEVLNWQIGY